MIILPNLKSAIIRPDKTQKILVGGAFTTYKGVSANYLARLNSIASLDSFSTGFGGAINTIAVQSDNKIICGGAFTTYSGNTFNRIIRLNVDGSVDNSFTIGTGFNLPVNSIAIRSDGKILCGGNFISYNGITGNRIAQLNSDGTMDSTSFISDTGFNFLVSTLLIQSYDPSLDLGYYLCGGSFTTYKGTTALYLARMNNSGALDTSFTTSTGFNAGVRAISIQSDGNIICGGDFSTYKSTSRNRIARLNTDGTLDTSFAVGTGFNGSINAIAIQSDNKIICGGGFTSYNGTARNRIIRLNTDGSVDSNFTIGTGFNTGLVSSIAIQSDGKILCGGSFTSYNGISRNRITRLNSDGTIDDNFAVGTAFDNSVNTITIK